MGILIAGLVVSLRPLGINLPLFTLPYGVIAGVLILVWILWRQVQADAESPAEDQDGK